MDKRFGPKNWDSTNYILISIELLLGEVMEELPGNYLLYLQMVEDPNLLDQMVEANSF
jgi:hypothetical protein